MKDLIENLIDIANKDEKERFEKMNQEDEESESENQEDQAHEPQEG